MMFSGFSFPAGKFRKEWWSPCREPQECVHRTLSAASYAKKKISHPFSACPWLGGACCEYAGCLEIFKDFFLLSKEF